MNEQMFDIEPITKITTHIIKKFSITNISINLFQSCSMTVVLYDENDKIFDGMYLNMNTDDYKRWNEDDNYLLNWIRDKINIS